MAAPVLRQSAYNATARYDQLQTTATFSTPTVQNNLVVVTAVIGGWGGAVGLTGPPGFTLIRNVREGGLQLAVWYYEGCPALSSVTVQANDWRSIQVRVMEYSGAAQTGALDQVVVRTDDSDSPLTGYTNNTAQPDSIIVACIANRFASCSQSGFGGGLTRLFESVSPRYYGLYWSNDDEDRTRCTHHQLIANQVSQFFLNAYLSSFREWVAVLLTFKGGSSGPKKLTSNLAPPQLTAGSGRGVLNAFGPLRSGVALSGTVLPLANVPVGVGTMFPFEYQYKLNGFLLTGDPDGSPFRVLSHDGLYGVGIRTSDNDQPRGDGSLRGIDLQSARQIVFEIAVAEDPSGIERRLDSLYRALVPRRDTDWDLVWRHPGQPAKLIRCRPIELPRVVDQAGTIVAKQHIALRAADPRHYSAREKLVNIPLTPAGAAGPVTVNVTNEGNIAAYPVITVTGPTSGPPVTRVELVNSTSLVTFDVSLTLPTRSVLIGDMQSRITGAPVSVVTLDGQSKYGSWNLPRSPFRLDADPTGQLGFNVLYLRTTPAGAPVTCTIRYRDTWAG